MGRSLRALLVATVLATVLGCTSEQQESRWADLYGVELQVRNFSGRLIEVVQHRKCDETAYRRMVLPAGGLGDGEEELGYLPGPGCYEVRARSGTCLAETGTWTDLEEETRMTWNVEPGEFSDCDD